MQPEIREILLTQARKIQENMKQWERENIRVLRQGAEELEGRAVAESPISKHY